MRRTLILFGLGGLVFWGSAYVGYDSAWALIWGEELANGESPGFEASFAPTPHPLLNVIGAVLAPLGDAGARAGMEVLSLAALVLLGVAAFRLGGALFSPLVGALCAALLLTRPELVELALFAQFDVPFLALVLLAAALEAEKPGRGVAPLVVLALAGLLRPEAWIIAGAYALWRRRPELLALAAVGPALWALHDVVLTGDPFFSLHHTREFAERHQPGNGFGDALRLAPEFLTDILGVVVAIGGALAWVLARPAEQRKLVLPAALFGLSLATFLAYGLAGLTLYPRFLLPAAGVLALLCSAGMTWPRGIVLAVAVAVTIPFTIAELVEARRDARERVRLEDDLAELIDAHRAEVDRCGRIYVPSFRLVPRLVQQLDTPSERFTQQRPEAGVLFIGLPKESGRDHVVELLQPDPPPPGARLPPPGFRTIAASEHWRLSADC